MTRFSRVTMLFIGFLALQFNALGGGVTCLLATTTAHAGVVSPSMAEMDLASANSVPVRSQSPCQQPSAPHSSCQSMTPCAAAFTIAPAQGAMATGSVPLARIAMAEVVPVSRSLSPELPPPKA